ncbi:hypothetical protein [Hoylesella enoeca]|uniref:Fimbrillin family protein n=1 Tax=Hoylesella enoeca TaxID=76123 RepID=A0A0S2KIW0_9BACT|nr:hypothetical protein [Hoylesella enoeca]ALO48236.1 hypothetical protein AS203_03315 [Hoylesella enoeca]
MKKTKLIFAAILLLTAACANEDMSKDNDQDNKGLTAFVSGDEPATRTSMDRTASGGGKFFWTTDDNIWVDNGGTHESSTSSTITGKTDYAKFYFASTFTGTSYPVTYTGKNSSKADEVTIAATQIQSAPNNTDHFAVSGDCGTATATGSGNMFAFKLKHQAAYLCILPRNENTELGKNLYLQKIVVTSDNDIAGTYTLASTGLTPKSGGTNTITLTTGSGNGFSMGNATTDADNSAYMVIAPGTHTLTIDCYVKDPATNVGTTLTQTVSATFAANTVTDITADVTPTRTNYPGNGYYMWDAAVGQHYWKGYEWNNPNTALRQQPTVYGITSSNYPKNNTDSRWYREDASLPIPAANRSAAGCPNANECAWYIMQGDPHWDGTTLWATMGHLYTGGMWLKKKANISGFNDSNYNGTDYRITINSCDNSVITQGKPSNLSDYFYLPCLGYYLGGELAVYSIGSSGTYWSSTPITVSTSYFFYFGQANVSMAAQSRGASFPLWSAQ